MCFCRLMCVRIEIDQLQCVNCWVIIHCLSVSCSKINHLRYALVFWSLQLTSKQWIITQQFTAGADLLLKQHLSSSMGVRGATAPLKKCINIPSFPGHWYTESVPYCILLFEDLFSFTNNVNTDEMPQYGSSLFVKLKYLFRVFRIQRVKIAYSIFPWHPNM